MDTMYQPGKIQEESLCHKHRRQEGSLPLGRANTSLPKDHDGDIVTEIELIRSTPEKEGQQIRNVEAFRARGQDDANVVGAHLQAATRLSALQSTACDLKNVFAMLMEAVKTQALRRVSPALYEAGGEYRRNM